MHLKISRHFKKILKKRHKREGVNKILMPVTPALSYTKGKRKRFFIHQIPAIFQRGDFMQKKRNLLCLVGISCVHEKTKLGMKF